MQKYLNYSKNNSDEVWDGTAYVSQSAFAAASGGYYTMENDINGDPVLVSFDTSVPPTLTMREIGLPANYGSTSVTSVPPQNPYR